jgi:hypothetical protein
VTPCCPERQRLEAENLRLEERCERLEEALRAIAEHSEDWPNCNGECAITMAERAREALGRAS